MKTICRWLIKRQLIQVLIIFTYLLLFFSLVWCYWFISRGCPLAENQLVDRKDLTSILPITTNTKCDQMQCGDCISSQGLCNNSDELPELIFVAGIEGSGHHLIDALFQSIETSLNPTALPTNVGKGDEVLQPKTTMKSIVPSFKVAPYIPSIHSMAPALVDNTSHMGFAIIHHHLFRMRLKSIEIALERYTKQGRRGLVYIESSPTGVGGILATSRPDLLMFQKYDCVLYRLKYIVLKRHPLPAVLSAIRRFSTPRFKGIDRNAYTDELKKAIPPEDYPLIMQARIIEDELIYLDQQLRRLECDQVHFIDISDVYSPSKKHKVLSSFASFLKLSNEETEIIQNMEVKLPITKVLLPPTCSNCTERVLYDFFEERKIMWPLMAV
jgi:hypothetical protein